VAARLPTTRGVHWPDLDGLRSLAITWVLARHSLRPFISEDHYEAVATIGSVDLTPLLLNGWIGVDLFFVLSGFLIGRQALRSRDGIRTFWFKRATRILPAYWVCLAVIAAGVTLGSSWSGRAPHFLSHIVMFQDYTGSIFVPAFWSLGAEEKFYLLTPLVVFLIARLRATWMRVSLLMALWALPITIRALVAAGDVFPIRYETYFPVYRSPFHMTAESLVVGFTIAWLTIESRVTMLERRITREILFWVSGVLLSCWAASVVLLHEVDLPTVVATPALVGLAFGLMVLACVSGAGSYSRILGLGIWRGVAKGSYTLYLTHMMVIPVAVAFARVYPWTAGGSLTVSWLNFLPWYLALSVITALALHRFVEQPVLDWRDRYLVSTTSRQPAVVSTA
jgi:peptidoglycan/LPS O-acetylase OafA/YrhL